MAVLTEPVANTNVFSDKTQELAPQGTHAATLVEVKDEFGVTIKDWDNPGATKKVDRTTFLFGLRDAAGKAFYVATRAMTISGNAKSALMGFLTAMLGYTPPYGVDYCTYKGHKCLVTVNHVKTKDGTRSYAGITTVCPMPSNMAVRPK